MTDVAKELGEELMREIFRLLDFDELRTTAYMSFTNVAAERFHRTLNSIIGKMIDENQRDRDSLLSHAMAAYRSSRHEATQCQKFSFRSCFGGGFWRAAKTGSRRCTPVTFGRQPAQVFSRPRRRIQSVLTQRRNF